MRNGDRRTRGVAAAAGVLAVLGLAPGSKAGDEARPPALVVHVRDAQGRPVPAAWVAAGAGTRSTTWTRLRDGEARLSRRATTGTAFLEVFGARDAKGAPLSLGPWRGPLAPDAVEATVVLPAEVRIDGVVRDAQGRGVADVAVEAFPEDGTWDPRGFSGGPYVENCTPIPGKPETPSGWAHAQLRTDADGRFSLGGLGEIRYAIWVQGPEDALVPAPLRVRAPASAMGIALTEGVSPTVSVRDAEGRPVVGAVVWALDPSGSPLRPTPPGRSQFAGFIAHTGPDGTARLHGLDPRRRVLLDVRPPEGSPLREVRLDPWLPRDETVRCDTGRTVTVVVEVAGEAAARGAWVQWKDADDPRDPWRTTQESDEGRFVTGLVRAAARVALRTRVPDPRDRHRYLRAAAVVPAGATVAVLSPAAAPALRLVVEGAQPGERVLVDVDDESVVGSASARATLVRAGEALFEDLWPGTTYAVHVWGTGDRCAWRRGVESAAGEVRLTLAVGRASTGRVGGPEGLEVTSVSGIVGGFLVAGTAEGGTRFRIGGLPEGPLRVEASLRDAEGATHEATGAGVAGEPIDLSLRPR